MKPEQLTTEHIEYLNSLYAQFFFPPGSELLPLYITNELLEAIVRELVTCGSYNSRIGSKWTSHSKLDIALDIEGNVAVRFEPNFDPNERERYPKKYQESLDAGDAFSRAFGEYLARLS